jgi:hypothetical protein
VHYSLLLPSLKGINDGIKLKAAIYCTYVLGIYNVCKNLLCVIEATCILKMGSCVVIVNDRSAR